MWPALEVCQRRGRLAAVFTALVLGVFTGLLYYYGCLFGSNFIELWLRGELETPGGDAGAQDGGSPVFEEQRDPDFAIGFHLGHSYVASVAWFRNGTTRNLARVNGSLEYRSAMEEIITSGWTLSKHDQFIIPVLADVKNQSEAILQQAIDQVYLATPWVRDYRDPWRDDDAFYRSLHAIGIHDSLQYASHVNEANAVLAANGRQICRECHCVGGPVLGDPRALLYISLTEDGLYTSNQQDGCLHTGWIAKTHLDRRHGLGRLSEPGADCNSFWKSLEQELIAIAGKRMAQWDKCPKARVLVAGDATAYSEYLSVLRSVVDHMQAICDQLSRKDDEHGTGVQIQRPQVKLLISDDPVFAAAKGAAFALQRHYWDYCGRVDRKEAMTRCWNTGYGIWQAEAQNTALAISDNKTA